MTKKSINSNKKTPNLTKEERFRALSSEAYRDYIEAICTKCENGDMKESERDTLLVEAFNARTPLYRNGGDGFCMWAEENVRVLTAPPGQSYQEYRFLAHLPTEKEPSTNRSWAMAWEDQKRILKEALVLREDGQLKHRLVVLSEPRGDGKSFMAVLIQLWKFSCYENSKIFVAANSKSQVSFAHYEEAKKYVSASPTLLALIGGIKYLIDKELAIRDANGRVISFIRSISSFSGIMSNASGYTFSEFFASPPDGKFFYEIDSSMRNVPNAIGVIDSTVSTKDHTLYKLYQIVQEGLEGSDSIYYYYKDNPGGDYTKFRNPLNDKAQIDGFRVKYAAQPGAFSMFFENTWQSAASGIFTDNDIKAMTYIGYKNKLTGVHSNITATLTKIEDNIIKDNDVRSRGVNLRSPMSINNPELRESLVPVSHYLPTKDSLGNYTYVSGNDLDLLGDILDTDWVVGIGIDRCDPMSKSSSAESIMACIAKGLPGSRSHPEKFMQSVTDETLSSNFLHIVLHIVKPYPDVSGIYQNIISDWVDEYSGIESMCSDRYQIGDIESWLRTNEIVQKPEILHFVYERQKELYRYIYELVHQGLLKITDIDIPSIHGSWDNFLLEQFAHFQHTFDGKKGKYESDEKSGRNGVQDDALEAVCMGIWGLRHFGVNDLRQIGKSGFFGAYFDPNGELTRGGF